jgi:hypothetical protein
MRNPTDRQAFADALEHHDTAAAYATYLALATENARLREALRPFALWTEEHAGDEESDDRPMSLCNDSQGGDAWYCVGDAPQITRGMMRRTLVALSPVPDGKEPTP